MNPGLCFESSENILHNVRIFSDVSRLFGVFPYFSGFFLMFLDGNDSSQDTTCREPRCSWERTKMYNVPGALSFACDLHRCLVTRSQLQSRNRPAGPSGNFDNSLA